MERREPSYTVGGNVNWCSHYGEQYGGPHMLQYFGHLMRRVDSLAKTLMLGGIEGKRWWAAIHGVAKSRT